MEQDMKYIYQIWQDRSFTKAAEHLFITQPALSTAVRRVEESIGAPLFDRSRRPLELTEAGMIYIEAIRKMNYLENELSTRINDLHDSAKKVLGKNYDQKAFDTQYLNYGPSYFNLLADRLDEWEKAQ